MEAVPFCVWWLEWGDTKEAQPPLSLGMAAWDMQDKHAD